MKLSLSLALTAALAFRPGAFGKITPRQQGSLPVVTSEGNAFWADGERFYIRGVAYQPGGAADAADPLVDIPSLRRDIGRFRELGINTIRVYTIDNSRNHDEAMRMLDDAGIYLALDANTPKYSLNRESLDSLHASYNEVYLQSVFATIDAFSGYNNLLLFFSGNEVINARNNTNSAPYIKAVTRDMRQYISSQAPRRVPVGYSSADVAENIYSQAQYFACGRDSWARADFFAFNDYSWCSPSSLQVSGWADKAEQYSNYTLPLFLSEFGCITNERTWGEIAALYGNIMAAVYSGGLVYEYTLEANGYGLVEENGNGQVVPNADFRRLASAYRETRNPTGTNNATRSRPSTPPSCPPRSEEWEVSTRNLPAIPAGAVRYIRDGAGRGPGLSSDAKGSQWAGTPSETRADLSDGEEVSENVTGNGNGDGGDRNGSGDGNGSRDGNERASQQANESGNGTSQENSAAGGPIGTGMGLKWLLCAAACAALANALRW